MTGVRGLRGLAYPDISFRKMIRIYKIFPAFVSHLLPLYKEDSTASPIASVAAESAHCIAVKMAKDFYLYENISKISPFEGPQYHLAPRWVFLFQAAFMGFVFFVGTPLNTTVLFVTAKYKKLRQPLNFILVNISLAGFIFDVFSVSQVFLASLRGYYFLGHTMCALESAMGTTAGS